MPVWINEFHYDNVGTDLGERIEIVATVGTDVSGYSIVRYNGNTPGAAVPYTTPAATNSVNLSAITPTTVGGFSYYVIIFPSNGLQNGPNDGFALVNGSTVVQLLSYAGVFTAAAGVPGGVAAGQTSTDVGQTQSNTTTPVGDSLQLTGTGDEYSDFIWSPTGASTFGGPNTGQTLVGGGGGETQTVVFNPISVTHNEGNSGTTAYSFIVTRTGGTTGQLDFSGTIAAGGTNNADYVGGTAPTVFSGSILAGQTSATVTVNIQGDYTIEPSEAFTLTLTSVSNTDGSVTASIGTDLTATGNVTNDDSNGAISVADTSLAEGNAGTTPGSFTLTRAGGASGTVSVDYVITLPGGVGGADGSDVSGPLTGTVTFLEGETTASIPFTVNGDVTNEPNETFTVALSNAQGGATISDGNAIATITNDDAPPVISIGDASRVEGDNGVVYLVFTVSLSKPSIDPVTVDFETSDGTALEDSDYLGLSGQVSFAPGDTSETISVPVIGDDVFETNETLTVTLSNPSGATIGDGTATGTITNDDGARLLFARRRLLQPELDQHRPDHRRRQLERRPLHHRLSRRHRPRRLLHQCRSAHADRRRSRRRSTSSPIRAAPASPMAASPSSRLTNPTDRPPGLGHRRRAEPRPLHGCDRPQRHPRPGHSARHRRQRATTPRNRSTSSTGPARAAPGPTLPGGYFSDVTTGGSATQVTAARRHPARPAPNNAATLEIRIMTTNAARQ